MSLEVSSGVSRGQSSQIQGRWRSNLRCHLMRVRVRVRRIIYINFHFCLVIFYICILVCFLPRNISMEEDLSRESAGNKLLKIADTFPCYLGSMLDGFLQKNPG